MSRYRCIFCAGKIEEYEDELIANYSPSDKEIKESGWDVDDSDYDFIICTDCGKNRCDVNEKL